MIDRDGLDMDSRASDDGSSTILRSLSLRQYIHPHLTLLPDRSRPILGQSVVASNSADKWPTSSLPASPLTSRRPPLETTAEMAQQVKHDYAVPPTLPHPPSSPLPNQSTPICPSPPQPTHHPHYHPNSSFFTTTLSLPPSKKIVEICRITNIKLS